jgi:hypothetical protein
MFKKIADLEKVVYTKIVHRDEFCYWLKLMYLFLLHVVCGCVSFNKLNLTAKFMCIILANIS